jgi:pimeloyl-ACP methyl ester carboxylesterase
VENFIAATFAWIGENENVLSGLVAIAVLVGLAGTAARRLASKPRTKQHVEAEITQEIRYCRTTDGVRIAYAATGQGTPIVRCLGWYTHLETEWSSSLGRSFWQRLSREHRLFRYDGRGMGLSDLASEFSFETRINDLEAVVDDAELDRFALLGTSEGSGTALRYATKHPERVTHLILYGSNVVKNTSKQSEPAKNAEAYLAMIESGWGKPSHQKLFADLFLGASPTPEETEYFMELQRTSASQEVVAAYFRSMMTKEMGFEDAAKVSMPTLLLHPRDDQICPFQNSLDLAAEIPGARLKPLEGDCHWLLMTSAQSEEYIRSIEAFLGEKSTAHANGTLTGSCS